MKTVTVGCLVAAALFIAHPRLTAAETARFRHVLSVYADEEGGGLNLPEAVACDAKGHVIVGDTGNDRLLRFTYQDQAVTPVTEIKLPEVSAPSKIQLNSQGEIFVLDAKQRRIVRLAAGGEFKGAVSFEGVPAPATIVPKDFAIDSADNLYVLDVFSARVLVLDGQGQYQRVLPLPENTGFGSAVAVDSSGTLLVLDSIQRRIFSAAKDATAFTPVGGDLKQYIATIPTAMVISKGIIFVVEGNGGSIAGFGRDGAFVSRQLTMGWNEGLVNHPAQMCVSDRDDVFIADRDNSRVQVFQLIR